MDSGNLSPAKSAGIVAGVIIVLGFAGYVAFLRPKGDTVAAPVQQKTEQDYKQRMDQMRQNPSQSKTPGSTTTESPTGGLMQQYQQRQQQQQGK